MRTLLSLLGLIAPSLCIAMSLSTIAVMLADEQTRELFDVGAYAWVLAPYIVVGITSFLARKNLVAVVFGFIAVAATTWLGVILLYEFRNGAREGKGMAVGIVPIIQWEAIGGIAGLALIGILTQEGIRVLIMKVRQRSV